MAALRQKLASLFEQVDNFFQCAELRTLTSLECET